MILTGAAGWDPLATFGDTEAQEHGKGEEVNPHIKLAIEAIQKQMRLINLDANLFEQKIVTTPHAQNCYLKREKLRAAIQWLESNALPLDPAALQMSMLPEASTKKEM